MDIVSQKFFFFGVILSNCNVCGGNHNIANKMPLYRI